MLMHRITLATILFLAAGATNADAQFCYPGRCGYYRPFMHRPYAFSHYPNRFSRNPMPYGNGHGHWYGGVPGGLGNPYSTNGTAGGGQVAPMDRSSGHGTGYDMPGGLSNPYGAGAASNANRGQNSAGGQVAEASLAGHHHRYVPGGLGNPYNTSGPVGGDAAQSSGGAGQRYSESNGNASSRDGYAGNNTSAGGHHQTDGQRSDDSSGQQGNGGVYGANGPAAGNFSYSCTINDSEEDAGAACKRTSVAQKHSGDRCSCHGEWGTVD